MLVHTCRRITGTATFMHIQMNHSCFLLILIHPKILAGFISFEVRVYSVCSIINRTGLDESFDALKSFEIAFFAGSRGPSLQLGPRAFCLPWQIVRWPDCTGPPHRRVPLQTGKPRGSPQGVALPRSQRKAQATMSQSHPVPRVIASNENPTRQLQKHHTDEGSQVTTVAKPW